MTLSNNWGRSEVSQNRVVLFAIVAPLGWQVRCGGACYHLEIGSCEGTHRGPNGNGAEMHSMLDGSNPMTKRTIATPTCSIQTSKIEKEIREYLVPAHAVIIVI